MMLSAFVKRVARGAGHLAFGNAVYNWSLGGGAPRGFVVSLADHWPGDADRGRWLCARALACGGDTLPLGETCWEPEAAPAHWRSHLHGFEWLRDLRALGGDAARQRARQMTEGWIDRHHACDPALWRADYTGRRLAHWIAHYDFFGASADDAFQARFFSALARQARHLSRSVAGAPPGLPLLEALRGLVYCGIALPGREGWLAQGLDLLQQETAAQIMPDGGHVSRSPRQLLCALQVFIDIRCALLAGGYPVPAALEHSIDRMAQALRFFRYPDKRLALFHGAQEGSEALIDLVLLKSNARGKVLRSLPQSGFERLIMGRSLLTVDCGAPPAYPHDAGAHAAPLAFEFLYGKERVFVSCGAHPLDPAWQDSLRATAAHNALTLDYRNAGEIRDDRHFGRRPRRIVVTRQDSHDAALVEAAHDGYVALNGITHRRRLYLGDCGHDLRGEESLTCVTGLQKPVTAHVRFHLHPRVLVSLIQGGREALLRLPGGAGWRFFHSGGHLSLENSIYLGEGVRPRKTKQLVIAGTLDADVAVIKWALQRERLSR